jgi:hypothetical protein
MIDGGSVLLRCHTSPRAQSRGIFHVRSSLPSLPLAQTDTAGCPTCGPLSGAKRTLCARSEYFAF